MRITTIITATLFSALIVSCGSKEKPPQFQLPESIEHPAPGVAKYITPRALIDSLNRGVQLDILFLKDVETTDSQYIVPIPGMVMVEPGEMFYISETLSTKRPIYLVCLYGDDSKRMAGYMARYGYNCYYLDGGSYRLWEQMERNGWKILPRLGTVIEP